MAAGVGVVVEAERGADPVGVRAVPGAAAHARASCPLAGPVGSLVVGVAVRARRSRRPTPRRCRPCPRCPSATRPAGRSPTGAVVGQPSLSVKSASSGGCRASGPRPSHSAPQALRCFTEGAASPHGYLRPSEPRAANSHSASVGSRLPSALQKRSAIVPVDAVHRVPPARGIVRVAQRVVGLRVLRASMPSHLFVSPARLQSPRSLHAR